MWKMLKNESSKFYKGETQMLFRDRQRKVIDIEFDMSFFTPFIWDCLKLSRRIFSDHYFMNIMNPFIWWQKTNYCRWFWIFDLSVHYAFLVFSEPRKHHSHRFVSRLGYTSRANEPPEFHRLSQMQIEIAANAFRMIQEYVDRRYCTYCLAIDHLAIWYSFWSVSSC